MKIAMTRTFAQFAACLLLFTVATPTLRTFADPKGDKKSDKKKKDAAPEKKPPEALGFKVGPRDASKYEIDAAADDNEVTFTSKTAKETFVGKTTQITGSMECKPRALKDAKGKFAVAWTNLDTGKPMRNQHMMAEPWVDAGAHPEIVFTLDNITKMKAIDKRSTRLKCTLVGTFVINGAEKELKIPATLEYRLPKKANGSDTDGQKEGVHIQAKFSLSLKDFGITGRGVGDKVAPKMQIDVSLFLPIAVAESPEPTPPPPSDPPRGRTRRPGR
ncbi:MAG: YceI family protein [Phycisphaerae bacterium]|nr:YceI family protein [Phycisphaerae bacterium]